ncbi:hypothetical protein ACFLYO_11810 [Chloroflexota bacterium]
MATAQYHVGVDWQQDGSFAEADDSLDRHVIQVEWALGLNDPAAAVAAPSWAVITLRDRGQDFVPDNADSPYYGSLTPHKAVRITSEHDGTTRTHFTGWIESCTPQADGTTVLRCSGVETLLQRAEIFAPLGVDQTGDQIIAAILAQVAYPPALNGYWVLGKSCLGVGTRLPDITVYADLETGCETFAYVGDNWPDGISAWEAVQQVTAAEGGLCFVDRDGLVVFWNRHHLHKLRTAQTTITGQMADFAVSTDGRAIVNRSVITCHPRTVGTGNEVLWTLPKAVEIPANGSRVIRARFVDDSGARIGALSLVTPVAGTDYSANERPDASGQDCTAYVHLSVAAGANHALLTCTNTLSQDVYLLPGLQVRGVKLTDWGPVDAIQENALSITYYGRRIFGEDVLLLDDPAQAERLARHLVVENKDPRSRATTVTLAGINTANLNNILSLTIGDAVQLTQDRTAHDTRYHIVGERHTVTRGGNEHTVTWTVRIASPVNYWLLGVIGAGELGQKTTPGY